MILFLNGSPKQGGNNSEYFFSQLKKQLSDQDVKAYSVIKTKDTDAILSDAIFADVIIIASPLYVDSLPSHVLRILKKLEFALKDKDAKAIVYGIVNCGFYEGKQTRFALRIIRAFCHRTGLIYGGGLGIGCGEMLGGLGNVDIHNGPNKYLGQGLEHLAQCINQKCESEDMFIEAAYTPKRFFVLMGNTMWPKLAKRFGNPKSALKRRIYEPKKTVTKKK